jgi:hypothetical protein
MSKNSCYGIQKIVVEMGILDINVTPKHEGTFMKSSQHLL